MRIWNFFVGLKEVFEMLNSFMHTVEIKKNVIRQEKSELCGTAMKKSDVNDRFDTNIASRIKASL